MASGGVLEHKASWTRHEPDWSPAVAALQYGVLVQAHVMVLRHQAAFFADSVPPKVESAAASVVGADRCLCF